MRKPRRTAEKVVRSSFSHFLPSLPPIPFFRFRKTRLAWSRPVWPRFPSTDYLVRIRIRGMTTENGLFYEKQNTETPDPSRPISNPAPLPLSPLLTPSSPPLHQTPS